jgi:hypothetical protein
MVRVDTDHRQVKSFELAPLQQRFQSRGPGRLFSSTPAEAAAFAAKETAMWREVVRLSGLTPQ